MLITRKEDIVRITVRKEELNECYVWKEPQEIKIYEIKEYPWYTFKKDEKIYVDSFTTSPGFYSHMQIIKNEHKNWEWIHYKLKENYQPHIPNNKDELVKDNKLYVKSQVIFNLNNGYDKYVYFDTYKEAIEYAKTFMKFGLEVIITDDPLDLCEHKNMKAVTNPITMESYCVCASCGIDMRK